MNPLEKHRKKINKIDSQILKLISDRQKTVKKIKAYKKKNKLPITDKSREKIAFKQLGKKAKEYKLDNEHVGDIYKVMLKHSKKLQKA